MTPEQALRELRLRSYHLEDRHMACVGRMPYPFTQALRMYWYMHEGIAIKLKAVDAYIVQNTQPTVGRASRLAAHRMLTLYQSTLDDYELALDQLEQLLKEPT